MSVTLKYNNDENRDDEGDGLLYVRGKESVLLKEIYVCRAVVRPSSSNKKTKE